MKRSVCRLAFVLLSGFILLSALAVDAKRTSTTVRKERHETAQKVERTRGKIKTNVANTRRQMAALQTIEAQISRSDARIKSLTERADSISARVEVLSDSIEGMQQRIKMLQASFASSLRTIRRQRQLSSAASYIFSSSSFTEARKRMRYLGELSKWESEKAAELKTTATALDLKKVELDSVKVLLARDIEALKVQKASLEVQRTEADVLVSKLKKQGRQLEVALAEQQSQIKQLDDELNRVIEEEIRIAQEEAKRKAAEEEKRKIEEAKRKAAEEAKLKAAEAAKLKAAEENAKKDKKEKGKNKPAKGGKKQPKEEPQVEQPQSAVAPTQKSESTVSKSPISSNFADAKGRLPMPVSDSYIVVSDFGRHTHQELSKVQVQNNGIDIETVPGASALAVYPGVVSMIIVMDGYHNVVLVRHGEYLTVYAGISTLEVRKGQAVRAGQSLGKIYSDTADENRTRLHFEVRHEKDKLDPAEWLK